MVKDFIKNIWKSQDTSVWLVFLRLIIGVKWFIAGLEKLIDPGYVTGMADTLGFFASGNPNAWFVNLINSTFIPNATVFAWLVSIGELLAGIGLILGIFVNLSAIVSIFLNLSFFFAAAWISPSTQSLNWIMAALGFIILLSPGIKNLSLDLLIVNYVPKLRRPLIDWFGFEKLNKK